MFDDSGFGGNSMFDMNHDGHLNGFEADARDCFLHDKDTYDQVKVSADGQKSKSNKSSGETSIEVVLLLMGTVVITVLVEIIKMIGKY